MPLDEDSRSLLALIDTWESVPMRDDKLTELRESLEVNLAKLIAPVEFTHPVEELSIPVQGGEIAARTYRSHAAGPTPALVFLHGGGWVKGSIDHTDALCRSLASRSPCTVISVNYRLAPEHPYPRPLEDAYEALTWVADHARELDVDTARIGVCGESAGGNLAAALTLCAAQRGGPKVAFQVLLCPAVDASLSHPSHVAFGSGYALDRKEMEWYQARYLQGADPADPLVSPLAARLEEPLPPTSIMVAECDPLRDEGIAYATKLAQAGTDVQLSCWAGQLHSFFLFTARVSTAQRGVDEIARELCRLTRV